MSLYKLLIRPFLFRLDPERIHDFSIGFLSRIPTFPAKYQDNLLSSVGGLLFPSPIGLAAGFDKDARVFDKMYAFGFGSVEVGTLTPRPQVGNPKPRIDRFAHLNAVVNRMGFPNSGLVSTLARLAQFAKRPGPLGVNIGANKDTEDKISDYVTAYQTAAAVADYATINVSSPNTPGLRSLETGDALRALVSRMDDQIGQLKTPVFLKVSPDLTAEQIEEICTVVKASRISAVIVGNTTLQRPSELIEYKNSTGGLSGKPLRKISENALSEFYTHLSGKIPIVSVGGIATIEDVYSRILNGASLVQLYTGFIYEGPMLAKKLNAGLSKCLARDGFESLNAAIGAHVNQRTIKQQGKVASAIRLPALEEALSAV